MNRCREIGAIKKEWGGRVPIAVVYPNTYYVGMSNLALHLLYQRFNSDPGIVAERIFLQKKGVSVESGRPLSDFRAAAFTFSFEADYLNIPNILGKDIELLRKKRTDKDPILICGGPAVTMNPGALSEIFDVIIAGEIDEKIENIVEILKRQNSKAKTVEELSKVPGTLVKNLNKYPTHSVIWTDGTEFGHMHLVEIARGCPWRCGFCATPPIYAPYRVRNVDAVWKSIECGLPHRRHIGLIGSDVLGHPGFSEIATRLIEKNIKISLSSMRINKIGGEAARLLKRSGHKRATLGIEAGTERLRNLINKDVSDADIFSAVKCLAREGITNLKLYFMIGLPGENKDDVAGITNLTKEIRNIILKERSPKTLSPDITLVITPFVPKKLTPFKDKPFAGIDYLKKALKNLRSLVGKIPNTKITGEPPKAAELEYKLSQGSSDEVTEMIRSQISLRDTPR